jgi:integrase
MKDSSRLRPSQAAPLIVAGMRDAEIRTLMRAQLDFEKQSLTVGVSKSEAGEGRTIPLNSVRLPLLDHARWYTRRFGITKRGRHLFLFGNPKHLDPTRAMTMLKTVWQNIKEKATIMGRRHDTRHTLVTKWPKRRWLPDHRGHVRARLTPNAVAVLAHSDESEEGAGRYLEEAVATLTNGMGIG